MLSVGVPQSTIDFYTTFFEMLPVLTLTAVEYGPTFKPEFVNSFEIGMKNSLFNDKLSLNLTGFYYDYKNYQVSQIRDRTAVNRSEEHTSELQSLMRISYAVFCLNKQKNNTRDTKF